ncbi:MAG: aminotransferase [candidate division Kazan bacterium GW2011_GWA1_50_15]|uniref:ornithine aminotransferase n=2 Tax=Bacteria division Kazan-3B-28 TaxID=1798534 RepID=A0A0G1X7H9_UNCK3|nr:MAG: aminotransferase [candidate division Kazan bacterium GW2011_GWA1_50_15]KKW25464.1 MAG: Acetylornithine aminotransferase [candidate division Kazan bacterium GW2011_GWC1_52_13]KKW26770.1 MAG: Acetylornithine aminotransferase [candidate division Kazan bacterium GW2011_GWB1_52_7]HAV65766.1 ornithine--oxo-acid transaminase [Patescibacteria group bacterium]HCR42824.1 ornithine--oxo-acid transaminase [Patescibacteria group bacterium]
MLNGATLIELTEHYGAHNYHPLPVVISRAKGIWVWDTDGKRYLDMLSAYSAVNQGHCHPRLVKALRQQAGMVTLTSRAFHNDQLGPFLQELCELAGMQMALPMNTGAEAVETAIKTARKWGYTHKNVPAEQAEIIVCEGNFHGRTTTIVGFSSEAQYRDGFGPFTPGFKTIHYGDIKDFERTITDNTVAFLVEPIQGEAGVRVPPKGYLKQVRKLCRQHNILLMVDEIQTGFGRTGKMFCYQHEGIKPDVLIVGKALGGGLMPISAVLASRKILGVFRPGDHGSTFGGNPLACAVAREALRVTVEEELPWRSDRLGNLLIKDLRTIKNPLIKEVRGKGLFIGVELFPEAGGARRYCEALMTEGLLCKETHDDVIRFAPPLIIEQNELDWAMERIEQVLRHPLRR